MKRPLALCGFSCIIVLLVAAGQPAGRLWPLAALALAAFLPALLLWCRHKKHPQLVLVLATVAACLLYRAGYDALVVAPVRALAGTEATARAHVLSAEYDAITETTDLTLLVNQLDGQLVRPFRLAVYAADEGIVLGMDIEATLSFRAPNNPVSASANGYFIGASLGAARPLGLSRTPPDSIRLLQYAAGDNIRAALPGELGGVTAAMTVGDRRGLPGDLKDAFRMAGLSHMLVVSGLHLSIVSGVVYRLLHVLTRKRRVAGLGGILFTLFFMVFTGLTPSIIRSGVACIVLYLGPVLSRRADTLTSLGFAGLLLCLQNPYAPASLSLQLTFAATLGALLAGHLQGILRKKWVPVRRVALPLRSVCLALLVPACVVVTTLPVNVYNSLGISLLSLPANLLAVPLLAPLVLTGFAMALPAMLPFGLLVGPAALANGVLQSLVVALARWCQGQVWAYMVVSGSFLLVLLVVVYFLVYMAFRTGRRALHLGTAAACLCLGVALHFALSAGTVHVVLAGSTNPSVVVVRGRQAAVVLRSSATAGHVESVLARYNVRQVTAVVDIRTSAQGTQYERFGGQQLYTVEDYISGFALSPLEGVDIVVRKQGGGNLAGINVAGYTLAVPTGAVDLAGYPAFDTLVAGTGRVSGGVGSLLVAGTLPAWARDAEIQSILFIESGGGLWLRPGRSVRFVEVRDIETGHT